MIAWDTSTVPSTGLGCSGLGVNASVVWNACLVVRALHQYGAKYRIFPRYPDVRASTGPSAPSERLGVVWVRGSTLLCQNTG